MDRPLRRKGQSRRPAPEKPASTTRPFKQLELDCWLVDLKYQPQVTNENKRRCVFVAIDRATRWLFIGTKRHETAMGAKSFFKERSKAAPFKILPC